MARTHRLRETGHYDPKLVDMLITRVWQSPAIDAGRRRRYSTKGRIADTHRTQEPQTLTVIDVR